MIRSKIAILMALVLLMAVPAGAAYAQGGGPVQISAQAPLAGVGNAVVWDDVASSDAITYAITGVTAPAAGTSYEGWVKMGSTVKSTGVMTVAVDGSISHSLESSKQLLIPLKERNDSGQSGYALLTASGGGTDVMLSLSVGAVETELVHIHSGQCGSTLGGVVHGLTSFVGGSGDSMSAVGATLISLRNGDFAVNTHKKGEPGLYTSCGNIPTESNALTIALDEQGNSGQMGWVGLTANGIQTDVVVNIGPGVLESELNHIHSGQCGDTLGGVVHGLTSIVDGISISTVDVTLASLRNGDFAVNLHQKGKGSVYTACGNIPAGNSSYSGENLIRNYNQVLITIEPVPDNDPAPSGIVAFSAAIDDGPINHIRHLLADWPEGSGVGILTNLQTQLGVAVTHANLAKNATTIEGIHQHLEHVVNAIEGMDGENYGDLDGNGAVQDFGDGIGVLGHAVDRRHAGFASKDLPATSTVVIHGALVEQHGMNAADKATQARDQALAGLGTSSLSLVNIFLGPGANTVITLLETALNGSAVEGPGAVQAFREAQLMATYTLEVGPGGTPAPTGPSVILPPTSVGDTAVPLLAQIGLIASLILLAGGGFLVLRARRSRIQA
jgi:hypothetical protein